MRGGKGRETVNKPSEVTQDTLVANNYLLLIAGADSFPPTDGFGDLAYRNRLTDTMDNAHKKAIHIQAYLRTTKLGAYFCTTDSTVVVRLANGKTASFANWDNEKEEGYTFVHYLDKIDYYLLRVQWVEGNCWMLVNRKNGNKHYLSGFPYVSPDNKQMMAIGADLEAGYSFNGLALYTIHADSLQMVFSKETPWGPLTMKWVNEQQFLLKREHFYADTLTGMLHNRIDYARVTLQTKNKP